MGLTRNNWFNVTLERMSSHWLYAYELVGAISLKHPAQVPNEGFSFIATFAPPRQWDCGNFLLKKMRTFGLSLVLCS